MYRGLMQLLVGTAMLSCVAARAVGGLILPSPTPTATASTAVNLGNTVGPPGGIACVAAALAAAGTQVTGTVNDIGFDAAFFAVSKCTINPDIGSGTPSDKVVSYSALGPGAERTSILGNLNPIPDGPLYACDITIAAGTPDGPYTVSNLPGHPTEAAMRSPGLPDRRAGSS